MLRDHWRDAAAQHAAGNQIEANTRRVLEERGEQWERLTLTEVQVREHGLPVITKHDRRFKNGGGEHKAVEAEAITQHVLTDILRERLDELLPEPLVRVQEREVRQRRAVRKRKVKAMQPESRT